MTTRRLLLLALLTGCTAPAGPQTPTPSAPSASPSATPSSSVPGQTELVGALTGTIYDDTGTPLADGTVQVRSLNPSHPFEATTSIRNGAYTVPRATVGIQLEVTASASGYSPRTQLVTLGTGETRLDFGSPLDSDNAEASGYALSPYPEIAQVEPAPEALLSDATQLAYTLTLSKPLDAPNQARFARALRVLPINAAAGGGASALDLTALTGPTSYSVTGAPYQIREGSTFLSDSGDRAVVSWDANGRVATFKFAAPLLRARSGEARYQVALTAASGRIFDQDGRQLGMDDKGDRTRYPADEAQIVNHVFRRAAMRLDREAWPGTVTSRWQATHAHAMGFKLPSDGASPVLKSVRLSVAHGSTRITLRFNEPLAAFDGTREGRRQANLLELSRFSFTVGPSESGVAADNLDGQNTTDLEAATSGYSGRGEFKLRGDGIGAALDPHDPATVTLTVRNHPTFFARTIRAIKARVEGLADPAGNAVTPEQADARAVIGPADLP